MAPKVAGNSHFERKLRFGTTLRGGGRRAVYIAIALRVVVLGDVASAINLIAAEQAQCSRPNGDLRVGGQGAESPNLSRAPVYAVSEKFSLNVNGTR